MENELKRLLDVELAAEAEVDAANRERERIMEQALAEAQAIEARAIARIPELRAPYLQQATERAEQAAAGMHRRFEENSVEFRTLAVAHEQEAITAALRLVLGAANP
jgi:vacuolar-type H+-ATPase subunit H